MKTLKDYTGTEAIDMMLEVSKYITPLITDKDIMGDLQSADIGKIGAMALKKYPDECKALRAALGNEPATNVVGEAYGISQILIEFITDKDVMDFFTSMSKTMTSSGSATENTKAEG